MTKVTSTDTWQSVVASGRTVCIVTSGKVAFFREGTTVPGAADRGGALPVGSSIVFDDGVTFYHRAGYAWTDDETSCEFEPVQVSA